MDWDGRRRLLARLGPEADDAIDELLAEALAFETTETPTIEAFLARMAAGDVVIKRQQDGRGGEVRVMSTHGAKGLEAPVVILPDTTRSGRGARDWSIARIDAGAGSDAFAAMPAGRRLDPAILAEAREKELAEEAAEDRRLLYVAATRAEDWLIVAGAGDDGEAGGKLDGTWYGMVRAGLETLAPTTGPSPAGEAKVHATGGEARTDAPASPPTPAAAPVVSARPAPPPPRAKPLLRRQASALGEVVEPGGGRAPELAARRGEAIHAVLEAGVADEAAAARLIAPFGLDPTEAALAASEALAARALPGAEAFFAPDAIAEAGVAVVIGGARIVGRIDRLIVAPDRVAFVDFKSDAAPPPESAAPEAHLAQLAAYRAALAGIYPGRRVEAHILWTAIPRLDRIDDGAFDRAAATLGAAASS